MLSVAALERGEAKEGEGEEEEEEKITTGLDVTFAGDGTTAEKIKSQQEVTMNAWVDQQMGGDDPEGDQADKGPQDHRAELFDVKEDAFKEACFPFSQKNSLARNASLSFSVLCFLNICQLR